ncbi:MAG: sensor histidine kinase [Thermoplasmatota archaeon]
MITLQTPLEHLAQIGAGLIVAIGLVVLYPRLRRGPSRLRGIAGAMVLVTAFFGAAEIIDAFMPSDVADLALAVNETLFVVALALTIVAFAYGRIPVESRELASALRELQHVADELSASEAQLREAQAVAHIGNWSTDFTTGAVYWSDEARVLYDVSRDAPLTPTLWLERVHPDDEPRMRASMRTPIPEGRVEDGKFRVRRLDGTVRWMRGRARMDYGPDGRPFRLFGTVQDVTEQQEAEEAAEHANRQVAMNEKLAALGTLVAGVAHEINNPLQSISARLETNLLIYDHALADPALTPLAKNAIEKALSNEHAVLASVDRIGAISASLKRIARSNDGGRSVEDVHAIIDGVLTAAAPRLRDVLSVDRDFRATGTVLCNVGELSQVFLNLVLNAAEAMDHLPGPRRLTLRTHDAGESIVVEVSDTGPGVLPEVASKLFTPFFTTKPNGTGLGLSISHRIVEDHGGVLSLEPRVGRGATFAIKLPRSTRPLSPAQPAAPPTADATSGR